MLFAPLWLRTAPNFNDNLRHYTAIFSDGNADYAIPKGAQSDPDKLRQLAAFFFWTSWASSFGTYTAVNSFDKARAEAESIVKADRPPEEAA